ncbi:MAG: dockerin type I domain-containing protein, partial [Planctomycetota bacterium]
SLVGSGRNDMRFGRGANGEMYISSKQNGKVYQVTNSFGQFGELTLVVDRDTNELSIFNPNGAEDIDFSGYAISSASGQLNPDQWSSLQDQGVNGWQVQTESQQQLGEVNDSGSSAVENQTPWSLGPAYQAGGAPFGEAPPTDVQFSYRSPEGDAIFGLVQYVGEGAANNLVLNVDPASGVAELHNDSNHVIDVDGLTITSASGALDPLWTPNEGALSDDWVLSNPSEEQLAVLNPDDQVTLAGGGSLLLGTLFTGGEAAELQDLQFDFILVGEEEIRDGVVRYQTLIGETGDFNADGLVDGADFLLWQRQLGLIGEQPADGNRDGVVDVADLAIWETQYGIAPVAAANATVPEPASVALSLLAGVLAAAASRSSR